MCAAIRNNGSAAPAGSCLRGGGECASCGSVGLCNACSFSLNGRRFGVVTNFGRRSDCRRAVRTLSCKRTIVRIPSLNSNASALGTASGCGRFSIHNKFFHIGCGCRSGCLLRMGKHCSNSSGFPGRSHCNFFPSISTN